MLDKVKSKYIVKEIFENIKNKRKLNIIKYNKKIKIKLDINKKDFENFKTLRELYHKFNLYIKDIEIKELDLRNRGLVYYILEYWKKLNLNN